PELLEAVVQRVPPPQGVPDAPLRALLFDCWYDSYRGAVIMLKVVEGLLRKGDKIKLMSTGRTYEVTELGCLSPHPVALTELGPGEAGFAAAHIKSVGDTKIGDTGTHATDGATEPPPGLEQAQPRVHAGLSPTDPPRHEPLRDA